MQRYEDRDQRSIALLSVGGARLAAIVASIHHPEYGEYEVEFACRLTSTEMREAVRLNRTKVKRMWWFVRNLRLIMIAGVLLVVMVANLRTGRRNWGAVVGLACAGALLAAAVKWSSSFSSKRMAKRINAACEQMTVDANGIGTANALGTTTFAPWSQFRGWHEGRLVFTVGDAKAFRTIPKSGMSEMQVAEVRGMLQAQIRQ